MQRHLIPLAACVAVLALAAPAVGLTPTRFVTSKRTLEAVAFDTNTVKVRDSDGIEFVRRAGVEGIDDTTPIDVSGATFHVSGWKTFDLKPLGVPADALMVKLGIRTIVSKGAADGLADIWLHARAPGSTCCVGPTGHESFPLDGAYGGQPKQDGMVTQTILDHAGESTRVHDWPDVRAVNGKIQLSWGYRSDPGDVVAIVVYLNGWTR